MHPPIGHCENGHSYCNSCLQKMELCPMCRAPHNPEAHHSHPLDLMHQYLDFTCEGCNEVFRGLEIAGHMEYCPGLWKLCPFSKINFCTWLGPTSGRCFEEHIRKLHYHAYCPGPVWTKSFSRFLRNNSYRVDFIMPSFNEWFCFTLIFQALGKRRGVKVFYSVHCAGNWQVANKYYANIYATIPRLDYTGEVKVPCFASVDSNVDIVNYMPTSTEQMTSSYIRKNGNCYDMTIKVLIVKTG